MFIYESIHSLAIYYRRASDAPPLAGPTRNPAANQRPVTMGRPVAAPAAPSSAITDANPRGIQIFRIFENDIRAEAISAVNKDGLNSHCAYVVMDPIEKEVYCWIGKNCAADNEAYADGLSRDLASHDLRSTRPVLRLTQLSGTAAVEHLQALTEIIFWQIISGINPISVSAELKQKCSVAPAPKASSVVTLEYNSSSGGQYIPLNDASIEENGKEVLKREILKPTRVVVIECGVNCYLWVGPAVTAAVVTNAVEVLRRRISGQPGKVLCQVRNTSEPTVFSRMFVAGKSTVSVTDTISPAPTRAVVNEPTVAPSPEVTNAATAEAPSEPAIERPLSVAERTKRFSKPNLNAPISSSSPAGNNKVGTPVEVEADPATLTVKQKLALLNKGKKAEQAAPRKQPIDIGVDVGLKEKRELMEKSLDSKKIHLNVADGVGQARRTSFSEDGPSQHEGDINELAEAVVELNVLTASPRLNENEVGNIPENNDKLDGSRDILQGPVQIESTTSAAEVGQVIGPPHTHKKHIPKFEPTPASPIIPITRKVISLTEGPDISSLEPIAEAHIPINADTADGHACEQAVAHTNTNEEVSRVSAINATKEIQGTSRHESVFDESTGALETGTSLVVGPPHSHKKNVPKFEPTPLSPIVPIARKSISLLPSEIPHTSESNEPTAVSHHPKTDNDAASALVAKEKVLVIAEEILPVLIVPVSEQKVPEATTENKFVKENEIPETAEHQAPLVPPKTNCNVSSPVISKEGESIRDPLSGQKDIEVTTEYKAMKDDGRMIATNATSSSDSGNSGCCVIM